MIDYVGVVVGGAIGFLSAFITDYVRYKREEKRWEEEKKIEAEKSAMLYYRNVYDSLAPFLSIPYRIGLAMLGMSIQQIVVLPEGRQEGISANLKALIEQLTQAFNDFVSRGYIGLFPKDLGNKLMHYFLSLGLLLSVIEKKPGLQNWDRKDRETLGTVLSEGEKIKSRLRQLLGVEGLD